MVATLYFHQHMTYLHRLVLLLVQIPLNKKKIQEPSWGKTTNQKTEGELTEKPSHLIGPGDIDKCY